LKKYRYHTWVWEGGGGGWRYLLPPVKFLLKATLLPQFWSLILVLFLSKAKHFIISPIPYPKLLIIANHFILFSIMIYSSMIIIFIVIFCLVKARLD
jgi:hypothetical protein